MKKRMIIFLLSVCMCLSTIMVCPSEVLAEDVGEVVELEEIMTENALIGYADNATWGVYLASGFSTINDAGNGKIGWGGVTNAAYRCTVSTNAIVERYVSGGWERVTSYTQTNTNALYAAVSRTLSVGSGYSYRVRCVHRANSDVSNSYTNALYM